MENKDSTPVEPDNFGITGMIYENEQSNKRNNRQKNEFISGVRIR